MRCVSHLDEFKAAKGSDLEWLTTLVGIRENLPGADVGAGYPGNQPIIIATVSDIKRV